MYKRQILSYIKIFERSYQNNRKSLKIINLFIYFYLRDKIDCKKKWRLIREQRISYQDLTTAISLHSPGINNAMIIESCMHLFIHLYVYRFLLRKIVHVCMRAVNELQIADASSSGCGFMLSCVLSCTPAASTIDSSKKLFH